jgi:deuterolysin
MISASLIALAAALSGAYATPYNRAETIAVDITSPGASIASVDGLKFTASVTNTGSESIKVLKYGTVLDRSPTRSFTVTKDGATVDFQGVKVCSPTYSSVESLNLRPSPPGQR